MNVKINGVIVPELNSIVEQKKIAAQTGKEDKLRKLEYPLPVGIIQMIRFYYMGLRG